MTSGDGFSLKSRNLGTYYSSRDFHTFVPIDIFNALNALKDQRSKTLSAICLKAGEDGCLVLTSNQQSHSYKYRGRGS